MKEVNTMAITDKVRCPQCGSECDEEVYTIPARVYPDPEPPDEVSSYWCDTCQKMVYDQYHRIGNLVPPWEYPDYCGAPDEELSDEELSAENW
jgi:DNA-directed RNA polymerase subunit RPC12/RpoP